MAPRERLAAAMAVVAIGGFFAVASAGAQSVEPPKVLVGAAVGAATPFHGDFGFIASSWAASVRTRVAKHVLVEGALSQWRHTDSRISTDISAFVNGVSGRVGRIESRSAYQQSSVALNLLATGSSGRTHLAGGGGVSLLSYRRKSSTIATDCAPQVAAACGTFSSQFSNGDVGIEGVASLDIDLTRHVAVTTEYRLSFPIVDFGSGDNKFLVGIRVK